MCDLIPIIEGTVKFREGKKVRIELLIWNQSRKDDHAAELFRIDVNFENVFNWLTLNSFLPKKSVGQFLKLISFS